MAESLLVIAFDRRTCALDLSDNLADLKNGSGEGVTAARAAILPPCAASAIPAPAAVARSCVPGGS